ncbi:hypothetical protein H9P43_004381 [Blastocladiella emersonii ATCC 22665]|nr:hypothetical protein H9P43_004381 [Blastocladiella emersonii ATCC 22665]
MATFTRTRPRPVPPPLAHRHRRLAATPTWSTEYRDEYMRDLCMAIRAAAGRAAIAPLARRTDSAVSVGQQTSPPPSPPPPPRRPRRTSTATLTSPATPREPAVAYPRNRVFFPYGRGSADHRTFNVAAPPREVHVETRARVAHAAAAKKEAETARRIVQRHVPRDAHPFFGGKKMYTGRRAASPPPPPRGVDAATAFNTSALRRALDDAGAGSGAGSARPRAGLYSTEYSREFRDHSAALYPPRTRYGYAKEDEATQTPANASVRDPPPRSAAVQTPGARVASPSSRYRAAAASREVQTPGGRVASPYRDPYDAHRYRREYDVRRSPPPTSVPVYHAPPSYTYYRPTPTPSARARTRAPSDPGVIPPAYPWARHALAPDDDDAEYIDPRTGAVVRDPDADHIWRILGESDPALRDEDEQPWGSAGGVRTRYRSAPAVDPLVPADLARGARTPGRVVHSGQAWAWSSTPSAYTSGAKRRSVGL